MFLLPYFSEIFFLDQRRCGLSNFVFSVFIRQFLTIFYRKMRLRTKKIDAPKANEPARLTTGFTLLNCQGFFYSCNIDFRDNISKLRPGVNFKHLHNPFSNLRIRYIVAGPSATDKQSTQWKRLEKLVITYEINPFSSYFIFNKLNRSSKWFFIFTNEKKTLFLPQIFPPQKPYHLHTKGSCSSVLLKRTLPPTPSNKFTCRLCIGYAQVRLFSFIIMLRVFYFNKNKM